MLELNNENDNEINQDIVNSLEIHEDNDEFQNEDIIDDEKEKIMLIIMKIY